MIDAAEEERKRKAADPERIKMEWSSGLVQRQQQQKMMEAEAGHQVSVCVCVCVCVCSDECPF